MPAFNRISVTQVDLPSFPLHLTCMIDNKYQVEDNFFDEMIFYRVIPGFLTQFGTCLFKRCASLYAPACCSNVVLHCDRLADAQYLGCLTTCRVSLAAGLSTPPLCLPLVVAFDCYRLERALMGCSAPVRGEGGGVHLSS